MKKPEVFNALAKVIASHYGYTEAELFDKEVRPAALTEPRHILIFMCRERLIRPVDIRASLEERGWPSYPSDTGYALRSMTKKIKKDKDYVRLFSKLNLQVDAIIN